MKVAVRAGHNTRARGASARIDETDEALNVKGSFIKYLQQGGAEVLDCTPGPMDADSDLVYGTTRANSWGADLYIPIHFNKAYNDYTGKIGAECLIYSKSDSIVLDDQVAQRIQDRLVSLGFVGDKGYSRGVKAEGTRLHDLRETAMAAIIVEVCFVEAAGDVALYQSLGYDRIGKELAEAVLNKSIGGSTPTPPPVVNPQPPVTGGAICKRYLYLKPHVTSWRVYPTNVAPITANACGSLAPSQFGGLEYEILGNPQKDVYTIQTSSFGKVNIYVPEDNDSEFFERAIVSESKPESNARYINLKPHVTSWRVYPTNKAPVTANACGSLAPSQFGGLSYKVLGNPQPDVYTIQTSSFGKVNIYVPRDNDSTITTSPIY